MRSEKILVHVLSDFKIIASLIFIGQSNIVRDNQKNTGALNSTFESSVT